MNEYPAICEGKKEKVQAMDMYSAAMRSTADENNLQFVDHPISTPSPEDLTGLPRFKDGYDY